MAVATEPHLLTYEEYLAEGEVMQRYDIVDGVREVTNPNRKHQRIVVRLTRLFEEFERTSGAGELLVAPTDILIRQQPLRVRQPDLLFISYARLAHCGMEEDLAPLGVAPELVIEILPPSETPALRAAKLEDYRIAGVDECWVVAPGPRTVEVLHLSKSGVESVAVYSEGQEVVSRVFPELRLSVAAIFSGS